MDFFITPTIKPNIKTFSVNHDLMNYHTTNIVPKEVCQAIFKENYRYIVAPNYPTKYTNAYMSLLSSWENETGIEMFNKILHIVFETSAQNTKNNAKHLEQLFLKKEKMAKKHVESANKRENYLEQQALLRKQSEIRKEKETILKQEKEKEIKRKFEQEEKEKNEHFQRQHELKRVIREKIKNNVIKKIEKNKKSTQNNRISTISNTIFEVFNEEKCNVIKDMIAVQEIKEIVGKIDSIYQTYGFKPTDYTMWITNITDVLTYYEDYKKWKHLTYKLGVTVLLYDYFFINQSIDFDMLTLQDFKIYLQSDKKITSFNSNSLKQFTSVSDKEVLDVKTVYKQPDVKNCYVRKEKKI